MWWWWQDGSAAAGRSDAAGAARLLGRREYASSIARTALLFGSCCGKAGGRVLLVSFTALWYM